MKIYRLGACLKCRGDLAHDDGDWLCLQCGLYYYTGLYGKDDEPGDGTLTIAAINPAGSDTGPWAGSRWAA